MTEIRIKDGWLLREKASQHLHELWGGNSTLANDEEMADIVAAYKKEWAKHEKKVLGTLESQLGVTFRKNIIDVYIAPWFYAFSDPLVMGITFSPEEFVDQLTHELIHILLTDNTKKSIDSLNTQVGDEWSKVFGKNHSFTTLIHIPVHALHREVYKALYKDEAEARELSERRKLSENNASDYLKAWQYVDEHTEDVIIDMVKRTYK